MALTQLLFGVFFIRQVWCIYEWLSVLHFKRSFIFPTQHFSKQFLRHTLQAVTGVIQPFVLQYLEQERVRCGSILPLLVEHVSRVYMEDGILSKDLFVSSLQVSEPASITHLSHIYG